MFDILILFCVLDLLAANALAAALIVRGGGVAVVDGATNPVLPRPDLVSEKRDAVLFRNGDYLFGTLGAIDAQKNVRWQHPDAAQPMEFSPTNIVEIVLRERPLQKISGTNLCAVQLSDGEGLEGNLISCDAEKIVLDTWYGGTLNIPRKFVQSLAPSDEARPATFTGPTGMEGWTSAKSVLAQQDYGQWRYKNGAFYATKAASIARDLKLPDMADIQFDVAWKGTFHMAIALYTDSLLPVSLMNKEAEPDFGGFYSLQLNNYFACDCISIKKRDPLKSLGQLPVPAFNQKSSAHIELRVSKPKHFIAMYVDGNFIKRWQDTEEFAGAGTAMRFVHQGQGAVKLSRLRVSDWDGQLDEPDANDKPNAKQDRARLRNGDRLNGTVQWIRDGKIHVETGATKLDVPLARLKQIDFASEKTETAKIAADDVRAFFPRGESITFHLENWSENEVVGTSASLGKVKFNPTAFERIQLTPKPQ